MIQLLYGDNDYALTQAMRRARDEFAKANGSHSVNRRDGSELTVGDLPQLLQGQSLFASAQLTIIQAPSAQKSVWDALPDVLDRVGDVDLLLIEPKPDKRTRTFKWLQKNATTRECKLPDERETVTWLQAHARELGVELSGDMARFLVDYAGTDQWRLHHDIEKLALTGAPVTRQSIDALIDPQPHATAFELLDAVVAGQRDRAMQKLAIVRRTEDPYKFLGLLVSQLYALAVCQAAAGLPSQQIAKDAGIHPYVAQKTLPIARKLTTAQLRDMVSAVERCDMLIKTSGGEPWTLIEVAIGTLIK